MKTDRRLIKELAERVQANLSRKHEREEPTFENIRAYSKRYNALKDINQLLRVNLVDIYNNDLFEIYVCNPEPTNDKMYGKQPAGSITGWDIKWVLAPNKEAVKQYPFFDCIITRNDNSTGQAIDAELFIPPLNRRQSHGTI